MRSPLPPAELPEPAGSDGGTTVRPDDLLREAVRGQLRHLVPACVCTMIHQGCEALVPVLIGVVVDQAIGQGSVTRLIVLMVALVVLFAVLTSSMRAGGRQVRRATQGAGHVLRVRLAGRVLDPRGTASDAVVGETLSTATSDTTRVGMVNAAVWTAAGAAAAIVVTAALLVSTSLVLGVVVVVGLIPVVALVSRITRPLVRRSIVEQAAAATAAGVATDFLTGLRVLKGIGAEPVAGARYAHASAQSRDAATRAAVVVAMRAGAITALTGAFLALVALVGAREVLVGTISVGEFVAALGLTQFLLGPFTRVALVGTQVARARASARRVATVLEAPPAIPAGQGRPAVGPLGLHVAGLAGGDGDGAALDLDVVPGEFVALVPVDATGHRRAEVLLGCLARERSPAAGRVELGGVALDALDPEAVRDRMLVARHDATLFTGTLRENVALAVRDGAGAERVAAAAHAAHADQVAETLPDGDDTVLTERGSSLSGGQRQRILLARALAASPDVLVLEDPTNAVDGVTEAVIAERVRTLRAGATTLVVTTSPTLLAVADRVVVLGAGRGAVGGDHDEMSRTDADYRQAVLS
jgi:putative ABC transport system ATP-binding protein